MAVKYRNIRHELSGFDNQQRRKLTTYYSLNKYLFNLLRKVSTENQEVVQYIEDTLFLPTANFVQNNFKG